jgi:hypothetical protein
MTILLCVELHNMMGIADVTEAVHAEKETETLAGNYHPSGTLDKSRKQLQPAKANIQSVHEELLQVTR